MKQKARASERGPQGMRLQRLLSIVPTSTRYHDNLNMELFLRPSESRCIGWRLGRLKHKKKHFKYTTVLCLQMSLFTNSNLPYLYLTSKKKKLRNVKLHFILMLRNSNIFLIRKGRY